MACFSEWNTNDKSVCLTTRQSHQSIATTLLKNTTQFRLRWISLYHIDINLTLHSKSHSKSSTVICTWNNRDRISYDGYCHNHQLVQTSHLKTEPDICTSFKRVEISCDSSHMMQTKIGPSPSMTQMSLQKWHHYIQYPKWHKMSLVSKSYLQFEQNSFH